MTAPSTANIGKPKPNCGQMVKVKSPAVTSTRINLVYPIHTYFRFGERSVLKVFPLCP